MSTPNTTNGAIEEFASAGFAAKMPDGSGNSPSVLQPAANEDHSEVQAEIEVLHSKNLMKRLDSTSLRDHQRKQSGENKSLQSSRQF